jgi:hypothetical protein
MDITKLPGTEQITIDVPALTAFLQEQKFAPSFIDDLTVILFPYNNEDEMEEEMDDDEIDDLVGFSADVWLYCGRKDISLNEQLLRGLRGSCHEYDQLESTEECFENWGFDPAGMTQEQVEADIATFANAHCHRHFVTGIPVIR